MKYDDNGSMLVVNNAGAGQKRTISWNYDAQPSLIDDLNGSTITYEYDAFGNRVVEALPNETIINFGSFSKQSSRSGFTNIYWAGDYAFASRIAGKRFWWHTDRSGSVRAVSDDSGQVLSRMNYGPFGEYRPLPSLSSPCKATCRFAGIDVDRDTGLQYNGARFYDPILNRFISADTIVPDVLQTQAANRFAYNYNNPLSYTDPSGHRPEGISQPGYSSVPGTDSTFDFQMSTLAGGSFPPRSVTIPAAAPGNATSRTSTVESNQIPSISAVNTNIPPLDSSYTFGQTTEATILDWVSNEEIPNPGNPLPNNPDSPEHVRKVMNTVNYYLRTASEHYQTRYGILKGALDVDFRLRNSSTPHISESLILRDAERYLWGRIGSAAFNRDQKLPLGLTELIAPSFANPLYNVGKILFRPFNAILGTHALESQQGNPLSAPGGGYWFDLGQSHYWDFDRPLLNSHTAPVLLTPLLQEQSGP
jgi:RHS repeat-associated protein